MNAPGRKMLLVTSIIMLVNSALALVSSIPFSFLITLPLFALMLTTGILGVRNRRNASKYKSSLILGIILLGIALAGLALAVTGFIFSIYTRVGYTILGCVCVLLLLSAIFHIVGANKNRKAYREQVDMPKKNLLRKLWENAKNAPGGKMLLVTSIIMIASFLLTGILLIAGLLSVSILRYIILYYINEYLYLLAMILFSLVVAIIGVRNCADTARYRTSLVCGILLFVASALAQGAIMEELISYIRYSISFREQFYIQIFVGFLSLLLMASSSLHIVGAQKNRTAKQGDARQLHE